MWHYVYNLFSSVRVYPVGLFCVEVGRPVVGVGNGWLCFLSRVRTCRLVYSYGQFLEGCSGWGLAQGFYLMGRIVRV